MIQHSNKLFYRRWTLCPNLAKNERAPVSSTFPTSWTDGCPTRIHSFTVQYTLGPVGADWRIFTLLGENVRPWRRKPLRGAMSHHKWFKHTRACSINKTSVIIDKALSMITEDIIDCGKSAVFEEDTPSEILPGGCSIDRCSRVGSGTNSSMFGSFMLRRCTAQ